MARQSSCWWSCVACNHWVWRGIVTGPDKPCPKCGAAVKVAGGTNAYRAREMMKKGR